MYGFVYIGRVLQYFFISFLACAKVAASLIAVGAWFQIFAVLLVKLSLATLVLPSSLHSLIDLLEDYNPERTSTKTVSKSKPILL